jgi:hypothetical protein
MGVGMSQLLADYLTEDELALELGVTVRALQSWRHERRGPPYTRLGKKPVYRRSGVAEWLRATEQHHVSKYCQGDNIEDRPSA